MSTSVAATDKFLTKEIQNEERRKQVKLLALSFLFRLQQIKQKPFCRKIHFGFRSECDIDCVYSCTSLYKTTNETFKGCHSSKVIESLSTFLFNVMYSITIIQIQKYAQSGALYLLLRFMKTVKKSKEYIMVIHVYCVFVAKELEKLNYRQVGKYV